MREGVTTVYDRGAVEYMRHCGIHVDDLAQRFSESCFWYPDGSLELAGNDSSRALDEVARPVYAASLMRNYQLGSMPWHENTGVTSLVHHSPVTHSRFVICATWVTRLRDGSLVVQTKGSLQSVPGVEVREEPPDRTLVTMEFVRTLRPTHVEVVRQTLRSYLATVQERGIDGEGPVSLHESLALAKRALQFRLDTSQCGHRTIVWLLLNLFPISGTNPLELISFTAATTNCVGHPPVYANQEWEEVYGPFDKSLDLP